MDPRLIFDTLKWDDNVHVKMDVTSTSSLGSINKIEAVQRWFTKRISPYQISYDERLFKLGIER